MTTNHFTLSFLVHQTPQQVFDAINNVPAWWAEDFKGASHQPGDEFEVRFFTDVHYSRHKLEEVIPSKRIVWTVTDSCLNFLQNKSEWTGTKMVFDIVEEGNQTKLVFTHVGLTPAIECFNDCSHGWTQFLLHSLKQYITTGKGNPNVLNKEVAETEGLINSIN